MRIPRVYPPLSRTCASRHAWGLHMCVAHEPAVRRHNAGVLSEGRRNCRVRRPAFLHDFVGYCISIDHWHAELTKLTRDLRLAACDTASQTHHPNTRRHRKRGQTDADASHMRVGARHSEA